MVKGNYYYSESKNQSAKKLESNQNKSKRYCPMCGGTFSSTGNCIRHVINIHKISREVAHTLWDRQSPVVLEQYEDEDDKDVVFAVDCSTHEEIPLKTIIIE
ncbi:hypothetical protein ACFFRR_008869 [Megaselia abdita]